MQQKCELLPREQMIATQTFQMKATLGKWKRQDFSNEETGTEAKLIQ
jgi:hypothetical protein